jgi:hypothetical protein
MKALLLTLTSTAVLALPALAQAQPNTFTYQMTLDPLERNTFTLGTFPKGEFAFDIRASSDGAKDFTLTQQRNGGTKFLVLAAPGPVADGACEGAAGSLFCTGITTPVTPTGKTWTFRMRNRGDRPLSVTLKITWRKVPSAG